MLELIAFVSYLLLPSDLDPRVNLTLTVFLGVIFFQIMLSELLPNTGYLTDMHWFTFSSTMLVVAIAVSHVIIFAMQSKAAHKEALLRRMFMLRKSRRSRPAVTKLQRHVRIWLARRRLQEKRASTLQADGAPLLQKHEVAPTASRSRISPQAEARVVPASLVGAKSTGSGMGPSSRALRRQGTAQVVLGAMGAPLVQRESYRARLVRLYRRANEAFEVFCVYCYIYVNWLVAFVFAMTYVAIILTTFPGQRDVNCS